MVSIKDFLSTNIGTREIMNKKKLLLYGTCIADKYPKTLEDYSEGRVALSVCLERDHMNMIAFKLATMVKSAKLEEIIVLTVDGSPHCVQLHHAVSEVNRLFDVPPSTRYFVVEHGKIQEVDVKTVKTSRFLSKISKLLKKRAHKKGL
ncbi:MAG: 4Fe-4S ferredoxin [Promethearchaeota archaeon]